jgi:hypothetical protein
MHLLTSCLRATYRAETPFMMPHDFGGVVQAVVRRALVRAGCASEPECTTECRTPGSCGVSVLLEPPLPRPGAHQVLLGPSSPIPPLLPLVEAPRRRVVAAGEEFEVGLRVLGALPDAEAALLVRAFEIVPLLDVGPDTLTAIPASVRRPSPGRVEIVSLHSEGLRNAPLLLSPETRPLRRLDVRFETPAWIEEDGALTLGLSFDALFRAIHRRLRVTAALFGELDDAFEEASEPLFRAAESIAQTARATHVVRWRRFERTLGRHLQRSGIMGTASFAGVLEPFAPYLRAAEQIHVGKLSGEGLGRIACTLR